MTDPPPNGDPPPVTWRPPPNFRERHRTAVRARLDADPLFRDALTDWRRFVRRHHGDAVADASGADDADATARRWFVDDLYLDFVCRGLLDSLAAAADVAVETPESSLSFPPARFRPLDERVASDLLGGAACDRGEVDRGETDHGEADRGEADRTDRPEADGADGRETDRSDGALVRLFSRRPQRLDGAVAAPIESTTNARAREELSCRQHPPSRSRAVDPGFPGRLRRRAIPDPVRRAVGAYPTPRGIADLALAELDAATDSFADATALDPACGTGAFLAAAIARKRSALADAGASAAAALDRIADTVGGVEIDPAAVTGARLAYLLAVRPLIDRSDADAVEVPVAHGDAVGLGSGTSGGGTSGGDTSPLSRRSDLLIGNPPWITWGRLPESVKRRWREGPIDRLDLFSRDGAEARLGHANDDLSLPFVWACVDRYLRAGGRAAFVLKRSALTAPAGELLRRGHAADRPPAVAGVHDFSALDPFDGEVGADAALYLFASAPSPPSGRFPIDATAWSRADGGPSGDEDDRSSETVGRSAGDGRSAGESERRAFASLSAMRDRFERVETALEPADPDDPRGPWIRADAERAALGECAHRIRHGVKDDAKAVFGLDRTDLGRFESDHVYPYLKSRHVTSYGLLGYDLQLIPVRRAGADNEAVLARETPRTYEYLRRHRERLEARASSWFDDGPFYSLFGIGPYTWAEYKVVWSRLGFRPRFAVVSTVDDPDLGTKPAVPGDHCMFVATDDADAAHYLCALLNSAPYRRTLRDLADGKSGLPKATVSKLRLPEWREHPRQRRLSELSRRAHDAVADRVSLGDRPADAAALDLDAAPLRRVRARVDRLVEETLTDEAE